MRWFQLLTLSVVGVALWASPALAYPRIGFGINIGVPCYGYGYGPYYRPYPYYYYPPGPIVVAGPPVVVAQPGPVVVASPPASVAVSTSPEPVAAPRLASTSPTPVVRAVSAIEPVPVGDVSHNLQLLTHSEESVRRDAVMELGRAKSQQAIEPLAATLAGDRSPTVRDAAARALGLIGSPRSLTVLIHAAQADNDRDVRHSAQFAVEVIQSNQRR